MGTPGEEGYTPHLPALPTAIALSLPGTPLLVSVESVTLGRALCPTTDATRPLLVRAEHASPLRSWPQVPGGGSALPRRSPRSPSPLPADPTATNKSLPALTSSVPICQAMAFMDKISVPALSFCGSRRHLSKGTEGKVQSRPEHWPLSPMHSDLDCLGHMGLHAQEGPSLADSTHLSPLVKYHST